MKKKNVFTLWLALVLCVSLMATSVWAGPKQRHRWQGVAIGVGAAVLGTALLKAYQAPRPAHPPRTVVVPAWNPPPYKSRWEGGHWEV
ncbi:MAG: hypothetical protein ABII06_09300, partial [Pseudomonadota bacterium]